MKRLSALIISLLIVVFVIGEKSFAQNASSVSASGHIFAEVVPIFTASETAQLNFGRFSPGVQGGEIILSPQSTVSVLGSVYKGSDLHNAASFYVTGDVDASYSITLPASPVILTHVSSAKTLQVKDWVSVPSPGIGAGKLQNGFQVIYVGATLKVGTLNDNPVGIYTGTYTISFDFN
jgi:hypothetical protein